MDGKAARHGKLRQRDADEIGLADKNPEVIERGTILGNATRVELSQPCGRLGDGALLIGNDHKAVAGIRMRSASG